MHVVDDMGATYRIDLTSEGTTGEIDMLGNGVLIRDNRLRHEHHDPTSIASTDRSKSPESLQNEPEVLIEEGPVAERLLDT